jgi:hypothetical protein
LPFPFHKTAEDRSGKLYPMPAATPAEKLFYHQAHPVRLALATVSGIASLYLLSRHWFALAALAFVVPSFAFAAWYVRHGDADALRKSRAGKYLRKWMTPGAHAQRAIGFALMCYAAWTGSYPLMAFGAACLLHAWFVGVLLGRR